LPATDQLEGGREAYAGREWGEAHERLAEVDRAAPLGADDLERLATSAYMLGREDDYFRALEREHQARLDAGETLAAGRRAWWLGVNLAKRGDMGRASGWLGRARRLVEREGTECVERGYLLLSDAILKDAAGDEEGALADLAAATEIAQRFGDGDLFGLAVHEHGHTLVLAGRVAEGLALLDEAMVAVSAGELSPIVSGIVYCGVILGCQDAYEVRRAREWTAALTEWWEGQPEMVAFTGRCLLHRAEILQLQGAWPDALDAAKRARERAAAGQNESAAAEAVYRAADVHRLRGDFAAAEGAYREASGRGREPQPGLALLRLAQGDRDAAAASIRRALGESTALPMRSSLLFAAVEILLAVDDAEGAGAACEELDRIAAASRSDMLGAMAHQARGAVNLAAGETGSALTALRESARAWQELEVPYEVARVRALVGRCCEALDDADAASLELEAARETFERLGAGPDLARLEAGGAEPPDTHGLTARELEVLRLVAGGSTNRAIAAELVLSERTVDRHVSNIFAKLRISSRAAATAYAYEHELV
jgi:DNA-binding CsgD family transcriptional regulator